MDAMLSRLLAAAFVAALSLPAYCQSPPAIQLTAVPDYVLYDHFLSRVMWLESQADNLKAHGKDDSFLRSWMKRNAGLTNQEEAKLKAIAADCHSKTAANAGAVQALAATGATAANSQVQALLGEQQQTVLSHVGQLQAAFGPTRYAVLDNFVRQTVRILVGPTAPPPAGLKPPSAPAPPK